MRKRTWIIIISLVVVGVVLIALKKTGAIGESEAVKVSTEKIVKTYHHRNSKRQRKGVS